MPLKTKQSWTIYCINAGDIDINHPSLKHLRQNIMVAHSHTDILMLIATTQFDLILLDLTANGSVASVPDRLRHSRHPWQSELIARIKDPHGINDKTPIIAIINPAEDAQRENQYPIEFDDSLMSPVTAEQLGEIIDLWQAKAYSPD